MKVDNDAVKYYFDCYSQFTKTQAIFKGAGSGSHEEVKHLALGLCGEAGEVADLVKKMEMPNKEVTVTMKVLELGDVFWYWIKLCDAFGVHPMDVINANIEKLEARYGRRNKE